MTARFSNLPLIHETDYVSILATPIASIGVTDVFQIYTYVIEYEHFNKLSPHYYQRA